MNLNNCYWQEIREFLALAFMKKEKLEQRQEPRQELTKKAKIIEEAKKVAWHVSHKDSETKAHQLQEMFPQLSDKQIEDLIQ